ncbi:RNA-binding domain-containing protein [Polyporus arcularius HHB13444]|uniref:RNA-binding domain-containing protein n=1 Tax=Polyporus arcularius HHB13444 TaxID=1314778 RepID=A0A5C3PXR1_9APHY|nr:RNA-binding domain-containing protein [Polyporus arcularius HHB13444]
MVSSSSSSSASDSEQSVATSPHPRKRQRLSDESDNDASSSENDSEGSQSDSDSDAGSNAEKEPVLSHAEKRRQKKKEKVSTKSADAAPSADGKKAKVQNTAELPPSKVPKRQNSVWVGNLSFKTTPASLKSFFEGVGEITRVHMPMKMATGGPDGKPRKENRGFAYVDFASPDAKIIAITMSENPLDGRRLLIKDGDDFKGRPAATAGADGAEGAAAKSAGHSKTAQKILSVQKQPPAQTLFLGNLGFETTEETIRELFESHRAKAKEPAADGADTDKWIRKIRLGTFEDSGKCKGWAFVDFTSTEHATAALTNPRNHQLNGRKLVVEYASPEAVRRGGGGPPRKEREQGETGGRGKQFGTKRERPSRPRQDDAQGGGEEGEEEAQDRPAKRRRSNAEDSKDRGRDKGGKGARPRSKPGAALAMARREDVSIVPSQGKKIVF